MTRLLISVRSVQEAEIALANGADVIDVKEPGRGSLGRADDATVLSVASLIRRLPSKAELSMALGELRDDPAPPPAGFAGFVKVGLAHCHGWRERWTAWRKGLLGRLQPVVVAYADQQELYDVVNFGLAQDVEYLLIDTFQKDGRTLLDFLQLDELAAIIGGWHFEDRKVAVAGALALSTVHLVLALQPDLIAVRSAVCAEGQRYGDLSAGRIRQLADFIQGFRREY